MSVELSYVTLNSFIFRNISVTSWPEEASSTSITFSGILISTYQVEFRATEGICKIVR